MADSPGRFTRRTFIGWAMTGLLTSIAGIAVLPILPYLWPAPPKGQKKEGIKVTLSKSVSDIQNDEAVQFFAPKTPNSAFVMQDGGGDNSAGDLAFGGFIVKDDQGKIRCLAMNCSHLGCSVAVNTTDK